MTHKDVCGKTEVDPIVPTDSSSSAEATASSSASAAPAPSSSKGGFPNVGDHAADAVFLDLPEPWLAMEHVLRVLKPGKTMCSYSPCIEQVIKTCEKMRELGFHSIRMIEVRQRPYDAR